MLSRQALLSLAFIASTTIAGCPGWGDVPVGLRVDTGLEPQHIDEQVRFRTTYYFRVLEGCPIAKNNIPDLVPQGHFVKRINGNFVPLNDSLYRFRMTGQAAALFNKIHFESGVLRKEQIDPFGSSVQFNQGTNSFLPVSADQFRSQAKNDAAMNDISRMRKLLEELRTDTNLSEASKQAFESQLKEIIQHRLEIIKTNPWASDTNAKIPDSNSSSAASTKLAASSTSSQSSTTTMNQTSPATSPTSAGMAIPSTSSGSSMTDTVQEQKPAAQPGCNGQPSLKKYYLLGPEGSKELDPSDRLLMALSVDSKPLLGMLQQISEHKFQSHETSLQIMEDLLEERGRVFDAQRAILDAKDDSNSGEGTSDQDSLSSLAENLRRIFPTASSINK